MKQCQKNNLTQNGSCKLTLTYITCNTLPLNLSATVQRSHTFYIKGTNIFSDVNMCTRIYCSIFISASISTSLPLKLIHISFSDSLLLTPAHANNPAVTLSTISSTSSGNVTVLSSHSLLISPTERHLTPLYCNTLPPHVSLRHLLPVMNIFNRSGAILRTLHFNSCHSLVCLTQAIHIIIPPFT